MGKLYIFIRGEVKDFPHILDTIKDDLINGYDFQPYKIYNKSGYQYGLTEDNGR